MIMPFDDINAAPTEALLQLYANGDPEASRALTRRLLPRVLSHAERLLSNRAEAEDVVQEAMLRLWKIAPEWRQGEAQVSTWLYRVTVNLCTDRLRKYGRSVDIDAVAEPEDGRESVEAALIAGDRAAALQSALDTLPERQRQAVVLRHIDGLSNPDIARAMDIGVEAVESLTARGKRALRGLLAGRREELGYDDD